MARFFDRPVNIRSEFGKSGNVQTTRIQHHFLIRHRTLIMARQEHVHIISAGENIYPSYAATVRDYPDITQTFVFADTELYTNSLR